MYDKRCGLEIIPIPAEYSAKFSAFTPGKKQEPILLYFFAPVMRLAHDKFKKLRRLLLVSEECMYICTPEGEMKRCIVIPEVKSVLVASGNSPLVTQYSVLFVPGGDHNLLLEFLTETDMQRCLSSLRAVYKMWNASDLPEEELTKSYEEMKANLRNADKATHKTMVKVKTIASLDKDLISIEPVPQPTGKFPQSSHAVQAISADLHSALTAKCSQIYKALEEYDEKVKVLEEEIRKKNEELSECKESSRVLQERVTELSSRSQTINSDQCVMTDNETVTTEVQDEIDTLKSELRASDEEREGAVRALQEKEEQYDELAAKLQEFNSRLSTMLQEKMNEKDSEIKEITQRLAHYESEAARLTDAEEASVRMTESIKQQMGMLLQEKDDSLSSLEQEIIVLRTDRDSWRLISEKMEIALKAKDESLRILEHKLNEIGKDKSNPIITNTLTMQQRFAKSVPSVADRNDLWQGARPISSMSDGHTSGDGELDMMEDRVTRDRLERPAPATHPQHHLQGDNPSTSTTPMPTPLASFPHPNVSSTRAEGSRRRSHSGQSKGDSKGSRKDEKKTKRSNSKRQHEEVPPEHMHRTTAEDKKKRDKSSKRSRSKGDQPSKNKRMESATSSSSSPSSSPSLSEAEAAYNQYYYNLWQSMYSAAAQAQNYPMDPQTLEAYRAYSEGYQGFPQTMFEAPPQHAQQFHQHQAQHYQQAPPQFQPPLTQHYQQPPVPYQQSPSQQHLAHTASRGSQGMGSPGAASAATIRAQQPIRHEEMVHVTLPDGSVSPVRMCHTVYPAEPTGPEDPCALHINISYEPEEPERLAESNTSFVVDHNIRVDFVPVGQNGGVSPVPSPPMIGQPIYSPHHGPPPSAMHQQPKQSGYATINKGRKPAYSAVKSI